MIDEQYEIREDGRCRYFIRTTGEWHYADLLCYDGNGRCDCWDFLDQKKKRILRDMELREFEPGEKYQCKHLNHLHKLLYWKFLIRLMEQYPDNDQDL